MSKISASNEEKCEIMEERKLNKNKCIGCGHIFYTFGKTRRKLCEECVKARKRRNEKNYTSENYKNVYNKRTPKKDKPQGLNEFMRELEECNRSHGTHLTYGQYVTLTNK